MAGRSPIAVLPAAGAGEAEGSGAGVPVTTTAAAAATGSFEGAGVTVTAPAFPGPQPVLVKVHPLVPVVSVKTETVPAHLEDAAREAEVLCPARAILLAD